MVAFVTGFVLAVTSTAERHKIKKKNKNLKHLMWIVYKKNRLIARPFLKNNLQNFKVWYNKIMEDKTHEY